MMSGMRKVQRKLVTEFASRLQHAVLVEECRYLRMVGIIEVGPQVTGPEIRPKYIFPQEPLVLADGLPVAAFRLRIDFAKRRALGDDVRGFGGVQLKRRPDRQDAQ